MAGLRILLWLTLGLFSLVIGTPLTHESSNTLFSRQVTDNTTLTNNDTLSASQSCFPPPVGAIKILWDYNEQPQLETRIKGFYLHPRHLCVTIRGPRKKLIKRVESDQLYAHRIITEQMNKIRYTGTAQFRILPTALETIQIKLDGTWNGVFAGVALEFDQIVGESDSDNEDDEDDGAGEGDGDWGTHIEPA